MVVIAPHLTAAVWRELTDSGESLLLGAGRLPRESRVSGVAATRLTAVPRDNVVTGRKPEAYSLQYIEEGRGSITRPREVGRCPPAGDSRPGAALSTVAAGSG